MDINLYCVGKLNAHYTPIFQEYAERLRHYCRLRVTEVSEPKGKFRNEKEKVARYSCELEQHLNGMPYYVFDRGGTMFTSEEFARWLGQVAAAKGGARFVLGGSEGLSEKLTEGAALRISFSPLTFPHQLFRVLLAEQLYRAFTIREGHPYHK
jgi:23S rRNA (pseudouridine1915-N3)-methyltransferase